MKTSTRLWQKIKPFYREIAIHPFNVEMADGTLSKERFEYYIRQNIVYMKESSKVFSLIAKRANSSRMNQQFVYFSKRVLSYGCNLEKLFLKSPIACHLIKPSPACREYSKYIINTATFSSLEESIAAVLPCWWIYRELSQQMAKIANLSNPYLEWIKMNASQQVSEATDELITIVDEIAGQCTDRGFGLMGEVCERCSKFEWRFWDDSYRMNT